MRQHAPQARAAGARAGLPDRWHPRLQPRLRRLRRARTPSSSASRSATSTLHGARRHHATSRRCSSRTRCRRATWARTSAAIQPGDTVAVWGCGGVGLMAQKSAMLMGAGRVIAIDRLPERLAMARDIIGSETINYEESDSVLEELREFTRRQGPGRVHRGRRHGGARHRPAVRLRPRQAGAAPGDRPRQRAAGGDHGRAQGRHAVDRRRLRADGQVPARGPDEQGHHDPDRAAARPALHAADARPRAQRASSTRRSWSPTGCRLEEAPKGYEIFKDKQDGCMRAVFAP